MQSKLQNKTTTDVNAK